MGYETGNSHILHLMDTAVIQKTTKHIPRVITGALIRSEDSDTHSMRV
jgi:hypothetical protein